MKMPAVPAEITMPPDTGESSEIEVIADIDDLGSAAAMLGCGDDNPYH